MAELQYVIVRREPDSQMQSAARDWSSDKFGKPIGNDAARGCWSAMLSASPSPVTLEEIVEALKPFAHAPFAKKADAQLAAASPTMAEALEPFDRALDDFRSNFTDEEWKSIDPETHLVGNGLSVADLLRARSALSRARGETP